MYVLYLSQHVWNGERVVEMIVHILHKERTSFKRRRNRYYMWWIIYQAYLSNILMFRAQICVKTWRYGGGWSYKVMVNDAVAGIAEISEG